MASKRPEEKSTKFVDITTFSMVPFNFGLAFLLRVFWGGQGEGPLKKIRTFKFHLSSIYCIVGYSN